jgi:LmbE family N-acetylglucosaminyl deacetylase
LLSLLPHPRDAAVLVGGTLARYAEAGCENVLLSATGGEGEPADGSADAGQDLKTLRMRELHAAARVLGVRDLVVLDYPDGGLAGLEPEILEDLFFDLIRAVEPDIVVTVGADALEGDLDRPAVHDAATGAFFRVRSLAAGSASLPAKLYSSVWPVQHERRALRLLQARGVPTSAIPGLRPVTASSTSGVSTIIDVRSALRRKLEAVRQHASQLDPEFDRLEPAQLEDLWGQEFFARAFPHPWITGVIERDLLAGLAPANPAWPLAS